MRPLRPRLVSRSLLIAGLTIGCSDVSGGLDEETYVDVMARLSISRSHNVGTLADDSARASILAQFGLTGQELLDFAERFGDDVTRMDRLWDQIRDRVDSLEQTPLHTGGEGLLRGDTVDRDLHVP